jgi:hypothetical protein
MEELSYTSKFDGETTDDILGYANEGKTEKVNEYVKSMNVQDSEGEPDTVQVYDTDGVPHKVSKTELLKKSTLALPKLEDISSFVAVNAAGNAVGVMTKEQVASVLAELIGIATLEKSGLHPAAKFSQGDNSGVSNIDDIDILSTDIYNGNILENNATFIVKTYPASPAYMYQEAFSMYPIKRYWRAKVDGTWRGWIEL